MDRTQPVLSAGKSLLYGKGLSTHGSTAASSHTYASAGARIPHHVRCALARTVGPCNVVKALPFGELLAEIDIAPIAQQQIELFL